MVRFSTLVMASGGPSGIYYLGALQYLLNHQILKCDTVIGTSTGAIIGYLLAIGLFPHDIYKILLEHMHSVVPFEEKINIYKIFQQSGCYSNSRIRECLIKTTFKHHRTLFTFKTLYELSKMHLVINAFNYTKQCTEYFSYKSTPDMCVITAVCLSSCVPLLFEMQTYNGCKYIDGAIGSSFALNYAIEELQCSEDSIVGIRCQTEPPANVHVLEVFKNLMNRFVECQFELLLSIYKSRVVIVNIEPLKIIGSDCVLNLKSLNPDHVFAMIDHGYQFCKNVIAQKVLCP